MELAIFNLFGMLRVGPDEIWVLATAATPQGKSIERSLQIPLSPPIAGLDDQAVILFGAFVEKGARARISAQHLNSRLAQGGPDLLQDRQVREAFGRILAEIRSATGLD